MIAAGLHDTVHGAQEAFRAALQALSRPGRPQPLGREIAGVRLGGAMAHLLLTLCDEDTTVWWQPPDAQLQQWLRFHTGARVAASVAEAAFAVVTDPDHLPPLEAFAAGTLAQPERSCTLLVEVPSLQGGEPVLAHGPGIAGRQELAIAGLPHGFWAQWQANHAAFPQGVDVFFTCGAQLVGLPRTARVARPAEV
jgi:alpha-D-ribose 1-methylphosphonate 5-triphosphate synthase subunit PhnH